PLIGQPAAALAVRSHFFEFIESISICDARPSVRLAHELSAGCRYQVVLTTGGGLYRYQLYDEVEVVGHGDECPLIRFVGRSDRTSDMVGEKLNDAHVQRSVNAALAKHEMQPLFAMLVPAFS